MRARARRRLSCRQPDIGNADDRNAILARQSNEDERFYAKTCKAAVKSSPTTIQHPTFYRLDALPVAHPTASKHIVNNHSMSIVELSGAWPQTPFRGSHGVDRILKQLKRVSTAGYTNVIFCPTLTAFNTELYGCRITHGREYLLADFPGGHGFREFGLFSLSLCRKYVL